MRAHLLSMSKMSLGIICSHSFKLDTPQSPRVASPEAEEARQVGIHTHDMIALDLGVALPRRENVDPNHVAAALTLYKSAMTWLEPRRDRMLRAEVGMRYDTQHDRAVIGPRRGEPGYEDVGPLVLPGTLDLILRGPDGVLEVVDVKTGKKEYETPWQLYAQAVAASRVYAEKVVRVGYLYPRKTKCAEPEWETLDNDRLDEEAGRIAKVLRRLPLSEPVRGDWCFRCDARDGCPKWQVDAA